MAHKRSFFSRLTGSSPADDFDYDDEDAPRVEHHPAGIGAHEKKEEDVGVGQLPVDVYQTENEIIIRAFVAGVRPDDLNVSISREMVTIEGSRAERDQVAESDFFIRELFWGSFARTILLPSEIDIDNTEAHAKEGLLILTLPKFDKARQAKLKVRVG